MNTGMDVRTVELCCGSATCRWSTLRVIFDARIVMAGLLYLSGSSLFLASLDIDLPQHRGVPVWGR